MKFNLADENKKLRLKLSDEQEKFSREKRNLTDKIIDLENKVSDLEFLNTEQVINLKALEEEFINKTSGTRRPDSSLTKTPSDNVSKSTSPSCFSLHTSSISGINNYISLLAKAKDDVINYKKESAHLHSELEQYKKRLTAKNAEIELLKSDLEYARRIEDRKVCICHEVDSSYESLEETKFEPKFRVKGVQSNASKSYKPGSKQHTKPYSDSPREDRNRVQVSDAACQVNELESLMKNRLDEYIKKAKNIVSSEVHGNCHDFKFLEEERDYYCREYHRLKDKVIHAFRTPDRPPSFDCPFSVLDRMRSELKQQKDEIDELKRICNRPRKEPANECSVSPRYFDERLRKLESKELELSTINDKLASKVRKLEDQCENYRERIRSLSEDNNKQKSLYSQLRIMLDDSERSLFNTQDALRKCDSELSCAVEKISRLENDNKRFATDLNILENEKKCLKKNLVHLDHEKDSIGIKLDEKTEAVVRLERELTDKKKRVCDLERKVSKLEDSLRMLQNINLKTEESARHCKKSYSSMQQELHDLHAAKDALLAENRRLQDNLSAAVKDCFQSNNELQSAKTEVEDLKVRLQSYVSEVRRIEDILQIKEDERRCMLEQLKGLNLEYSSNNSKSRTADNSDHVAFDNLSDFRMRYQNYGGDGVEER